MKKTHFFLMLLTIIISSCKTYYMTPNSLKEQLQNIDPNKIKDAYDFRLGLAGVALKGGKNFYNGIDTIEVTDKNGSIVKKAIKTNTAIRLTTTNTKRVQLYFDSMFFKDSLVYGSKSHFLTLPIKPIFIDSISKVEIQ